MRKFVYYFRAFHCYSVKGGEGINGVENSQCFSIHKYEDRTDDPSDKLVTIRTKERMK